MPISLITPDTLPIIERGRDDSNGLYVCELFIDTLQGEGNYQGVSANFLRLSGCSLGCKYCDSTELWTKSQFYTYRELVSMCLEHKQSFYNNHLVITGGSPLLQQDRLIEFFDLMVDYELLSYVEIENECIIRPHRDLTRYISCWNNSPKLSNSGIEKEKRYKPDVIKRTASMSGSWFKFVVKDEEDLREIENDFLLPGLIEREQIYLMPMAASRKELEERRLRVAEMAMKNNFNYSDRLHIQLYDRRKGV
jgi:organic radical activating enzyme